MPSSPVRRPTAALLPLWVLLLLPLGSAAANDDIEESSAARQVTALLERDVAADVRAVWALSDQLRSGGRPALKPLRDALDAAAPAKKLAIARALILLEDHTRGLEAVRDIAASDAAPVGLRVAALRLVAEEGELEESEWLEQQLEVALEPEVKLAMARSLWQLNRGNKGKGKDVLLQFLRSTDPDLRAQGALALGEIGAATEAKSVLLELREEPTERGRSAALLLRILHMEQEADQALRRDPPPSAPRAAPAGTPGSWPLLDEIRELLKRAYVDDQKLKGGELEDAAAEGLTGALDEHSEYLSPAASARLHASLDPSYGGVGAYVQNDPRNRDAFTISRPIHCGPLDKAGLRSGDVILAIDGHPTEGLSVDECVRRLKGPAGTIVVISAFRRGWTEPRDFSLTRTRITVPTTAYDVLPGKIGFLSIDAFSEETAAEVAKILDGFDKQGIEGLVIDLRSNGGGYLKSAVDIASQFLPAGALVVSEKGRVGVWRSSEHRSSGAGAHRRVVPIAVLMDQFTASAAEILGGALQVHGRARLVGTMSYGKGSVQVPIELASRPGEPFEDREQVRADGRVVPRNGRHDDAERFTDKNGNGVWDSGEAFLDGNQNGRYDPVEPYTDVNQNGRWDPGANFKVTVASYFLPDGRNLKRGTKIVDGKVVPTGGLEPDVEPQKDPFDLWQVQAQRKLEESGVVRTWVEGLFGKDRDQMEKLARSDRRDPAAYPGFDEFLKTLDTRLDAEGVRYVVRYNVRRFLGDEICRELVGDVVDDLTLQAALKDLFARMKKDPASEPDLAFLAR
jgi:carboxyl-terminal processing protease